MSLVTPGSWLVAASAALQSFLMCFVMGCTEVLLRVQPQLLFQSCNFLFGHMSSPDSVISVGLPQHVQSYPVNWSAWLDGYGFPIQRCKLHLLSLTLHVRS